MAMLEHIYNSLTSILLPFPYRVLMLMLIEATFHCSVWFPDTLALQVCLNRPQRTMSGKIKCLETRYEAAIHVLLCVG